MTNPGGVERIIQDFLTQTNFNFNVENYLICSSYKPELVDPITNNKIRFFSPKRFFRYDFTIVLQMIRWVKENNIDILHSYNAYANNIAYFISIFTHIPMLCSEHGTVWKTSGMRKILDTYSYRRASAITANSSASKLMLVKKYGLNESKIEILKNPVPKIKIRESKSVIRKELNVDNDQFVVGTIARLVRLKSLDVFIRAAYKVMRYQNNVKFIIVGGGEDEQRLKKINESLGNSESIIFTGWRNDARKILKSFDLYVNTSLRESFGNVLIESGHEKIPVIAPLLDGIPEAVINNKNGILIEPTIDLKKEKGLPKKIVINSELSTPKSISHTALADEIIKLIKSPSLRKNMGEEGYLYAGQFTLDIYNKKLVEIYKNIYLNAKL